MLICLVGPPQAGKNSLADHLVAQHGYERVHLGSSMATKGRFANSTSFALEIKSVVT
jgi:adenylate kinase family enzyme